MISAAFADEPPPTGSSREPRGLLRGQLDEPQKTQISDKLIGAFTGGGAYEQRRDRYTELPYSSARTLVVVRGGRFVSLVDVPKGMSEAAASCVNLHSGRCSLAPGRPGPLRHAALVADHPVRLPFDSEIGAIPND